ncbi:MAG: hypothetical protein SGJ20_14385 [Planctomycetota bacterium]|nr:hypothetical protein [Planctomycetota bacterium]
MIARRKSHSRSKLGARRAIWTLSLLTILAALTAGSFAIAQEESDSKKATSETIADPSVPAPVRAAAATDATSATTAAAASNEVKIGVYASQIHSVNLRENQFKIDFYIWFRWTDPDLEPHKTFEVANGQIDNDEPPTEPVKLNDGSYYSYRHVVATITQFWDVTRFPMDDHKLLVIIDDSANEVDKLQYVADVKNTGIDNDSKAPGWDIGKAAGEVSVKTYSTNFGDTNLDTGNVSKYSRFIFSVQLERGGIGAFLKLFFGLFIAVAIALLAFFIKPTEVDPRFGLGIGAIFAAVASLYVVTSSLPDSQTMSMADMLHLLAFLVIFLSLLESTWSLSAYASEEESKVALSKRVDRLSFVVLTAAYVGLTIWTISATWWV